MHIKRDGGLDDEISFYLRILNVSESIKNSLTEELSNLKLESSKSKKNPNSFMILIDLNESPIDVGFLKDVLSRHRIKEEGYGLWVSINSEFDHGGFTLPEHIAKLYHELKGSLDVSYTIA